MFTRAAFGGLLLALGLSVGMLSVGTTGTLAWALEPPVAALEWATLDSAKGAFSISLPGTPKEQTQKVPVGDKEIVVTIFMVETPTAAWGVSYNDYPDDPSTIKDGEENTVAAAKAGFLRSQKATITKEEDVKIQGYLGKSFSYTGEAGGKKMEGHARNCIVGNRLYQYFVISEAGTVKAEDAEKFLKSFVIKK